MKTNHTKDEQSEVRGIVEAVVKKNFLEIRQFGLNVVNLGEMQVKDLQKLLTKLTTQTLTQLVKEVEARERARIVDAMHERYPVPDMNMAEVWPKDEQVRWAGIGEVIVYLQEITK